MGSSSSSRWILEDDVTSPLQPFHLEIESRRRFSLNGGWNQDGRWKMTTSSATAFFFFLPSSSIGADAISSTHTHRRKNIKFNMGVIIIIRISRLWNVFCPNDREGKWRHGCPTPERDGNKLLARKERRRGDAGGVVLQLLSRWVWLLLQDGRCAARESVRRRQLNNSAILSFSFFLACLSSSMCVSTEPQRTIIKDMLSFDI